MTAAGTSLTGKYRHVTLPEKTPLQNSQRTLQERQRERNEFYLVVIHKGHVLDPTLADSITLTHLLVY